MSRQAYVLAVDQSTQGTKGLLFDAQGDLLARCDRPHRQIVNDLGWVEHDPQEILHNTLGVCSDVIAKAGIDPAAVQAFGISNQRETSLMWDRITGAPAANAIVWQCARAADICARHEAKGEADLIREKSGIPLSPYFPASKLQWLMEHVPQARVLSESGRLAAGTIDTWLVFNLTKEHAFRTDFSNAARTQLFNIRDLVWDRQLCASFGIPMQALPEAVMSDSVFGTTDLDGLLPHPVPICGVLGDSNGALFAQNCRRPGEIKATYGTGSSVMMNVGAAPVLSSEGLAASVAWGMSGHVEYVLEGNLNYTGAVISWLQNEMQMISTAAESADLAAAANPADRTYFVPAFSGLGAPYWDAQATGMFTGITRTTGRREMVKACVECIAYQITDLVELMRAASGYEVKMLHADGGPAENGYLMQFQADLTDADAAVPQHKELSGMGAAYMAGISAGIYDPQTICERNRYTIFRPRMEAAERSARMEGWKMAVRQVLSHA